MTSSVSLTWFARHEIRLAWRDWLAMLRGGRPARMRKMVIALVIFAALMHLLAFTVVGRFANISTTADKTTFVVITASLLLAWLLIVAPIPTVARWGGLILLVALTGAADAASPDLPPWYRRLRIPLSVGAAVALGSGLAWTLALAQSLARAHGG